MDDIIMKQTDAMKSDDTKEPALTGEAPHGTKDDEGLLARLIQAGEVIPLPEGDCIYALVRHSGIEGILKQWAEKHGCPIWWGKPNYSDLIAVSSFVIVIDRRILGREGWDLFVSDIEEVNDGEEMIVDGERIECGEDAVCILIDNIDDWPLPRLPCVIRLSDDAPGFEQWLEMSLDQALQQAR